MSDLDMRVPEGLEDLALAEVCLCLPKEWPLAMHDFEWREPRYFWPVAILQQAARYPHMNQMWFSWGHTVGSVERPEPLHVETRFTGLMLVNPCDISRRCGYGGDQGRSTYSLPRPDSTFRAGDEVQTEIRFRHP